MVPEKVTKEQASKKTKEPIMEKKKTTEVNATPQATKDKVAKQKIPE